MSLKKELGMKLMTGLLTGKRNRKSMSRPPKIQEKTKQYNLMMTVEQYNKLANISSERQRTELEQVSVADLIRESIDLYIHVLEQENEETTSAD